MRDITRRLCIFYKFSFPLGSKVTLHTTKVRILYTYSSLILVRIDPLSCPNYHRIKKLSINVEYVWDIFHWTLHVKLWCITSSRLWSVATNMVLSTSNVSVICLVLWMFHKILMYQHMQMMKTCHLIVLFAKQKVYCGKTYMWEKLPFCWCVYYLRKSIVLLSQKIQEIFSSCDL